MIYSMTMFLNEYDLFDLKVKEESPYVDKIVVVESRWTHSGNPKPLNFPVDKYKDNDKILYLVIDDETLYENCEKGEDGSFHSRADVERNYPLVTLPIADDDVLIVVDCDEIINGENMPRIIEEIRRHGLVRVCMRLFHYYINVFQPGILCTQPYATTGKIAKEANLGLFRSWTGQAGYRIENCGNHFGWLGGYNVIEEKLKSFSHTEYATQEIIAGLKDRFEKLENVVARYDTPKYEIIEIDEFYPRTIRENLKEWDKYIKKKEKSMIDLSIKGWTTENELRWLHEKAKQMSSIVEVGCYKGRSTYALLSSGATVHSVDSFMCDKDDNMNQIVPNPDDLYNQFMFNVGNNPHLKVYRMDSVEASKLFEPKSIDMVFIDGDHSPEDVKRDILAWLPICKKLLCGHDLFYYTHDVGLGIVESGLIEMPTNAENDYIRNAGVDSIWAYEIPQ